MKWIWLVWTKIDDSCIVYSVSFKCHNNFYIWYRRSEDNVHDQFEVGFRSWLRKMTNVCVGVVIIVFFVVYGWCRVLFLLGNNLWLFFTLLFLFVEISSQCFSFLKSKHNKYHRMIWAHIISRGLVHLWTHIYMHIRNFIIRKSRSIIGW